MKCSFCGGVIPAGSGKMVVKNDGTTFTFCSSKCERNHEIRNPRQVKWTQTYRASKTKAAK